MKREAIVRTRRAHRPSLDEGHAKRSVTANISNHPSFAPSVFTSNSVQTKTMQKSWVKPETKCERTLRSVLSHGHVGTARKRAGREGEWRGRGGRHQKPAQPSSREKKERRSNAFYQKVTLSPPLCPSSSLCLSEKAQRHEPYTCPPSHTRDATTPTGNTHTHTQKSPPRAVTSPVTSPPSADVLPRDLTSAGAVHVYGGAGLGVPGPVGGHVAVDPHPHPHPGVRPHVLVHVGPRGLGRAHGRRHRK